MLAWPFDTLNDCQIARFSVSFSESDGVSGGVSDKLTEFANSVDLDEVAHYGPPHRALHCCQLVFEFST